MPLPALSAAPIVLRLPFKYTENWPVHSGDDSGNCFSSVPGSVYLGSLSCTCQPTSWTLSADGCCSFGRALLVLSGSGQAGSRNSKNEASFSFLGDTLGLKQLELYCLYVFINLVSELRPCMRLQVIGLTVYDIRSGSAY